MTSKSIENGVFKVEKKNIDLRSIYKNDVDLHSVFGREQGIKEAITNIVSNHSRTNSLMSNYQVTAMIVSAKPNTNFKVFRYKSGQHYGKCLFTVDSNN